MNEIVVTGIEIDLQQNTLRLNIGPQMEAADVDVNHPESATIDIGAGGRLLGVDLGEVYAPVMPAEPGAEAMVRSAAIEVGIIRDRYSQGLAAIIVPRRGEGYEITYPSGNQ